MAKFQSTPVIANGRIAQPGFTKFWRSVCFNPRPLLLTGESTRPAKTLTCPSTFQSTPVIANGRIAPLMFLRVPHSAFQSTPVIANGRIPEKRKSRCQVYLEVSIHARYC